MCTSSKWNEVQPEYCSETFGSRLLMSASQLGSRVISEYIRMPHYVPKQYPNIFGFNIFTEQISEYIPTLEIA